jgi:hypothetical protein
MSNAAEVTKRVLVYDCVRNGDGLLIDRNVDETDESYSHRILLYAQIFSCERQRETNSASS